MTGKERILAKLRGQPTDSLPLMPITMMFAANLSGVRHGNYARDHRVLADAQASVAERFGFDHVSAISDPAREASDLGAAVEWFDDQPPAIVESRALLSEKSKLAGLRLPGVAASGRMRDRVEAVRLLAERTGATRIVEGWVEGPCAMGAVLRGLNTLTSGASPACLRARRPHAAPRVAPHASPGASARAPAGRVRRWVKIGLHSQWKKRYGRPR